MIQIVDPGPRSGRVSIPSSKSRAHRLLICATLSEKPTRLLCHGISRDIEATVSCLRNIGTEIEADGDALTVRKRKARPICSVRSRAVHSSRASSDIRGFSL